MTHSTVNMERESDGSLEGVLHTIDITSLDSNGAETYNPSDELGVEGEGRFGISVRGQGDSSLFIVYDHVTGDLDVRNVSDGTNVASGTAVGEVVLHVKGV